MLSRFGTDRRVMSGLGRPPTYQQRTEAMRLAGDAMIASDRNSRMYSRIIARWENGCGTIYCVSGFFAGSAARRADPFAATAMSLIL